MALPTSRYFLLADYQVAGGRHPCIIARVSPRILGTAAFSLTNSSSLITDSNNNDWLHALLWGCQPKGELNSGSIGVTWSLPPLIAVWSKRDHASRAICFLPSRYMGQCRKIQAWHGISPNSTWYGHQRRESVWSGSSVGTPTPSPPPLSGWGGT